MNTAYCNPVSLAVVLAILLSPLSKAAVKEEKDGQINNTAALFLNVSTSPRMNGMGGCGLNTVDKESPFYNPGALGIFHLDKIFAVSFPSSVDWLPNLDANMKFNSFNISGGISTRLFSDKKRGHNIAFGVSYGTLELDYGSITFTDENGNLIGSINPREEADYYTAAIGIDYYARLGFGITRKEIKSKLGFPKDGEVAEGAAYDFGLLLELPFGDIFNQASSQTGSPVSVEFTPSFAYANVNNGDLLVYADAAQADPLPEMRKIGYGIYGGIGYEKASIFSVRAVWERDRWEVGAPDKINKWGTEIGLFGSVFIRAGSNTYDSRYDNQAYETFGYGLSLHGFLQWLMLYKGRPDGATLRFLSERVDITFDHARYNGANTLLDETTFTKLSLSF